MSEFSTNQLKYIDWLATSKYERKPATEQLFAVEIGVTDRTLRRWKLLPGFRESITKRARELLGNSLPEIYGALRREAEKGNFQHIKLALEMTGEYKDPGSSEDKPIYVAQIKEIVVKRESVDNSE